MRKTILFKKFLSFFVIISMLFNFIVPVFAVSTNWQSSPWTMEKAEHLAKRALFWVSSQTILDLYNAWSATNAVNLLFPSVVWPDRTQYNLELDTFKWPSFNYADTNSMRKLYLFRYYRDPYEAKMKLFSLFEDNFSLDAIWWNGINFVDAENHFSVLETETLWNFKRMVKKVLFDTAKPENSYAMWKYLDLLNGSNKNYPNENYARELLQLFLMLEYKPREDAETAWAVRNYTEADVASLAKILTWLRYGNDKKVYFDYNNHNTGATISFLTWSLKSWDSFSFYNSASWTIDNTLIVNPIWWNNGLADNTIDYIFSKRESEIADFLAWKMLRHYVKEKPTQTEIETLATVIKSNNFEIYPSVKYLLASDMMYSESSMNNLRYKNPLELVVGTLKLLHYKDSSVIDPLVNDTSILTNLGWTPYYPGSIFGRDGYDNNLNFMNAYFHNQWTTYSSKIAFSTWTWYYNLPDIIPVTTKTNSWVIQVKTSTWNTYSWSINLSNINIVLNENAFEWLQIPQASFLSVSSTDFVEVESDNEEETWSGETDSWSWEITDLTWSWIIENQEQTSTWTTETSTWTNEEIPSTPDVPEIQPVPETPEIPSETDTSTWTVESPIWFITDKLLSFIIPTVNAGIINNNTITFDTWTIVFPDFYILTNSWNIINLEWTYDAQNWNLTISSWSLSFWTWNYTIASSAFTINPWYNLTRDITIDEMITQFEDYLYAWKRLPTSVKDEIKNYLLKNELWADRTFLPNNTTYRNKYIKAIVSMMLTQPEYMLLSWYDQSETLENSWSNPINDSSKKLVMIELGWWYDWMNWIIPKSDFAYYQNIRWSLAVDSSNLIDLWEVYLNKNLEALKPFYDSWELRIVNRVWAPSHSRGHDTAAIQIASQKSLQTIWTPGLIWELIKNETNYLNNIALGTYKPPVYTNGRYINIWWSSIMYKNNLWWLSTAEKTQQINSLRNILKNRNYPLTTKTVFNNSTILDDVAKSWQESVWYTLSWRLNFTNNLMNNWVWITYYVPGGGWYDTHWGQLSGTYNLNHRTKDLVSDVTNFFNNAKASWKDLTIVIYSEFWRTLKINWDSWTDHWEWGGYFVLTTNNSLKNNLPNKVIWKISPEKEIDDWFWTGIDYRSIFSKILTSLYNIDATNYFFAPYNLDDDLNTVLPNPVFLRREVKHSYWGYMNVDFKFKFEDKNYLPKNASYIKFYSGEDPNNLKLYSRWNIENYSLQKDWSYKVNFNLAKLKNYYYKIEIVDNQYDTYIATWSFIIPNKFESNSTNQVLPLDSDSLFAKYNNTLVSWNTNITKLTLYNNVLASWSTNSWTLKDISFTWGVTMTFGTWETFISTLTNSWIWNWWFYLPQFVNKNEFLSDSSTFNWQKLKNLNVEKILKVWADTLWVWMQLNQDVMISFPANNQAGIYKIITSEDWITWSELSRKDEITLTWSNINFYTNKFSYFALLDSWTTDSTPDSFSFTDLTSQELNTSLISNEITISGINTTVSLSINSGEYSLNNWNYTTVNTTVNNWDKIKLRNTSSSNYSTSTNTTLTIWWISDTWTITTKQQQSSSNSWWGGGGWGWWYALTKDNCPWWDYSPSYYDKICGKKTTTQTWTVVIDKKEDIDNKMNNSWNTTINKKNSIEKMLDKTAKSINYKDKYWNQYIAKKMINWRYILFNSDWTYVNKMFLRQYDILKYLKTVKKSTKIVKSNTISTVNYEEKPEDAKIMESFDPIIFNSRYNEKYKALKIIDGRYILMREDGTYVDRFFRKQFEIVKYLK